MKKIYLLLVVCLTVGSSYAQENAVKLDLLPFSYWGFDMKDLNFNYERSVSDGITVGLDVSYMIPTDMVAWYFTWINDSLDQGGNTAAFPDKKSTANNNIYLNKLVITPEVKFYTGGSSFEGFYVAPYLRYMNVDLNSEIDVLLTNTKGEQEIGKGGVDLMMNSFGGGVSIGTSWKVGEHVVLDWHIIGVGFMAAMTEVNIVSGGNSVTDEDVAKENERVADTPFLNNLVFQKVDNNTVGASTMIPMPDFRMNFAIGIMF